jgi:hypothetical protein
MPADQTLPPALPPVTISGSLLWLAVVTLLLAHHAVAAAVAASGSEATTQSPTPAITTE